MAQLTRIVLTDDVHGGEAIERTVFGLDGETFEIDLDEANAHALRRTLAPYVAAGRRTGSLGTAATLTRVVTDPDPAALRAWAAAHQVHVPARGRIPAEVLARYRSAGN